ncbi:MAG TPA: ABC transporter ATP-binding protein, partial [Thermoanaerobaculia bacterium]
SSLVRCLLGEQRPTSGRARMFGSDTWPHRARLLERVGVVPEEPDAPPAMTAAQIADFCRRLYPSWDAASVARRLERFGVPPGTPFGRLSKGQKGQVLLAMALAPSPALLVLDDPTLGLDVVARRAFWEELVEDLADRGTTVFVTTHDLASVEGIATRVGILKQGRLALDEDAEALKRRFRKIRYGNRNTETRTEFGTELDAFESLRVKVRGWGIEAVVSNWDEGAFERFQRMDGVEGAESSAMSLEEIFLAVAGEPRPEAEGLRSSGGGEAR